MSEEMSKAETAPETWRVECVDGLREVSVTFRPHDTMPTWLAYCYAERRGGMLSQNSARHAVIELAANHKWDVERLLAPGQASRADLIAELEKARADIATLQGELSRAVAEGATLRRAERAALDGHAGASEKPHRAALLEAIKLARTDRRPVAEATMEALDTLRADAARRGIAVADETDRCATCKRDRDVCVCAPMELEAPHG